MLASILLLSTLASRALSATTVLVGSYTNDIHTLNFTPPSSPSAKDGRLVAGPSLPAGFSPSWVTQHPTLPDIIYAVLQNRTVGSVMVGRLSADRKSLTVLGTALSGGGAP